MTENPINVRGGKYITRRIRDRPFILEEGKIFIYPYQFHYSQELIGASNWFRSSKKFVTLHDEGLKKVKEELKV